MTFLKSLCGGRNLQAIVDECIELYTDDGANLLSARCVSLDALAIYHYIKDVLPFHSLAVDP